MFKFYKISDLQTVDKLIGDSASVKFKSAWDLNDPFELKFNLKVDPYTKGQKEKFFKHSPNKTLEDFANWQKQINDRFVWYREQEQREDIAGLVTLSCFSEKNENNLMWSHYADNHQGICIEYSLGLFEHFKSLKSFFASNKIEYSDIPPTINNLETDISKVKKMLFNKQSEWKYEKEYRVILSSRNETDFIRIDTKFINSVFLGCRCGIELTNYIIDICKSKGIKIHHGITFGNNYKVQFEEHIEGRIYTKTFW